MNTVTQAEYLAPSQAGRILEVSSTTVIRWARAGKLRSVRTPLGRLIESKSVDELLLTKDWTA